LRSDAVPAPEQHSENGNRKTKADDRQIPTATERQDLAKSARTRIEQRRE
jgi:hypothetical protein